MIDVCDLMESFKETLAEEIDFEKDDLNVSVFEKDVSIFVVWQTEDDERQIRRFWQESDAKEFAYWLDYDMSVKKFFVFRAKGQFLISDLESI